MLLASFKYCVGKLSIHVFLLLPCLDNKFVIAWMCSYFASGFDFNIELFNTTTKSSHKSLYDFNKTLGGFVRAPKLGLKLSLL